MLVRVPFYVEDNFLWFDIPSQFILLENVSSGRPPLYYLGITHSEAVSNVLISCDTKLLT